VSDMNNIKKNSKKKKINSIAYTFELLALNAAAIFLSVAGSVFFLDFLGLACYAAAAALFACAMFLVPSLIACLVLTIASAATSFFIANAISGNIISSLACLVCATSGALIYFGVKAKKHRTQITFGIACFLSVFSLGLVVASFLLEAGRFSVGLVLQAVDDGLTSGANYITSHISTLAELPEIDRAAYVQEIVQNTKAIIPALFIVYNSIIAYLATSFFKIAYNVFIPMANSARKKIKGKYWRLNISLVTAIVALTALVASPFASAAKNPISSIVLTNLIYMLAPGLCIVGIYFAYDKFFKERVAIFPLVPILGALFAVFFMLGAFSIALFVLVFVLLVAGLYATLNGDIKKLLEKAKKALFDDDDDNDDDDDDFFD